MAKDTETIESWSDMLYTQFIFGGEYKIVQHVKTLFREMQSNSIRYALSNKEIELEEKYTASLSRADATELTRSLILRSISLKNISALDYLTIEAKGEEARFYCLLQMLNLFHGCYVADKIATNSDFWNLVLQADIENKTFLSFHAFHYLYQMGKDLVRSDIHTSNLSGVFSMAKSGKLYEEDKLLETRGFLNAYMDKLIEISQGPVFEAKFRDFYERFNALAGDTEINKKGLGLLETLDEAVVTGWAGEASLAANQIRSLI